MDRINNNSYMHSIDYNVSDKNNDYITLIVLYIEPNHKLYTDLMLEVCEATYCLKRPHLKPYKL